MSRSAAMTRRLLPSCRRLVDALPASSSRSIPTTIHPLRLSPLVYFLDCPAAPLSTKSASFESNQSRLSAPLPPPPAPESSSPSSSSKPASLANSSPASVLPSTAYRRPAIAVVDNVTQPTPVEYVMYLVVTIVSLLAGASVVHNIFQPDMTLPEIRVKDSSAPTVVAIQSSPPPSAVHAPDSDTLSATVAAKTPAKT